MKTCAAVKANLIAAMYQVEYILFYGKQVCVGHDKQPIHYVRLMAFEK